MYSETNKSHFFAVEILKCALKARYAIRCVVDRGQYGSEFSAGKSSNLME